MLPLSQSGCSPAFPGCPVSVFSSWFAAGFSLLLPWQLSQGITGTVTFPWAQVTPSSAQPINSCPVHLLPGSGSTEPTWPHKRNPVFSSKICHLEKEILKLRVMVMSNLKKEEKWKWEESVCCSLNLSAQRMHRGPGWVLKYYFKMLPSDSGNSSSCSLWVSTVPPGLERAAGTGACWWTCHGFLWKKHRKPQSLGLQCCEETSPTWLAGLYPKKQMTLEQNLIFCFELSIF